MQFTKVEKPILRKGELKGKNKEKIVAMMEESHEKKPLIDYRLLTTNQ
jgi:hypothetical protein